MKIAIIVLYFGKLPNYYQLFLNSCKFNERYEWYIFGDDTTRFFYPSNVHFTYMRFDECKKLIQSKFHFNISLSRSQKLCDYKCAYGYIFEDILHEYDWWGHCDLDQIFGNLDHFITDELLEKYDKLFSLGHLTLYRNTYDNNRVFMGKLEGKERYKEVFSTERSCGFDEWLPGNVNELYLVNKIPVFWNNYGADINPYRTQFSLTSYCMQKRCYVCDIIKNSIFTWENGNLYQMYVENKTLMRREFPYVHFQKRKMYDARRITTDNHYYIIPNKFVDGSLQACNLLKKCTKYAILNIQYFKIKYKSVYYRIKNNDWKFQNCFKQV